MLSIEGGILNMAKKNFYPAIINGELIGIFKTWDDCKPHVTGIKGKKIDYAGFGTLGETLQYIIEKTEANADQLKEMLNKIHFPYKDSDIQAVIGTLKEKEQEPEKEIQYPEDCLHIYIDGSYDDKTKRYSYGVYAVKNGQKVYEENGIGTDTEAASMRQVAGELLGAERAIDYAINQGELEVVLFYDYAGVELWTKSKAEGGWAAKNKFTQQYQKNIANYKNQIDIYFVKVKAHVSKSMRDFHNHCNEKADQLAKQALGI